MFVQGQNGWFYGYWDRTMDPDGIFSSHDVTVFQHTHSQLADHAPDRHCVEAPLIEDMEYLMLPAAFGDQQHALLRLAQHDLVGCHAGFALRN